MKKALRRPEESGPQPTEDHRRHVCILPHLLLDDLGNAADSRSVPSAARRLLCTPPCRCPSSKT